MKLFFIFVFDCCGFYWTKLETNYSLALWKELVTKFFQIVLLAPSRFLCWKHFVYFLQRNFSHFFLHYLSHWIVLLFLGVFFGPSYLSVAKQITWELVFSTILLLYLPMCFSLFPQCPSRKGKKKNWRGEPSVIIYLWETLHINTSQVLRSFTTHICIIKALSIPSVKSSPNTSNKTKHLFNFIELRFFNIIWSWNPFQQENAAINYDISNNTPLLTII